MRRLIITAALLVTCAVPAWAQGIKLEFHNGRVTLNAENVPLRTILNAWAQQGGTRIVNGDRIPGGLVTLAFNDVPERQALDAILRNASGYIAGPRTPGQPGASSYASILILPVSAAAAAPPPSPQPAPQPAFPFVRPIQRVSPPPDADDDPDIPTLEDNGAGPQRPGAPQRFFNRGQRQDGTPQRPPIRNTTPNDDDDTPPPAPSTTPTPANPFGVNVGSSQPGVISPVPTPNPQQPRPRPDPEP
jgi:hypothetical protein